MQSESSKPFSLRLATRKLTLARSGKQAVVSAKLFRENMDLLTNRLAGKEKQFKAVVAGPPGTGEAFLAQLQVGQQQLQVYRVDLSRVISPSIAETEKNFRLLFTHAEEKRWTLFFDEADALFGKRTEVKDAHDKYANQEVAYLLQRIEEYKGSVIISVNTATNTDDCKHYFDAVLRFPPGK